MARYKKTYKVAKGDADMYCPYKFDYEEVTATNSENSPTQVIFKVGGPSGNKVFQHDISYDANGGFQNIEITEFEV